MEFRRTGLWMLCAALLAAAATAQEQDFSKVELKTTKIAPGLAMLEGVGGFAGGKRRRLVRARRHRDRGRPVRADGPEDRRGGEGAPGCADPAS
jgi:hypothetical protein